MCGISGLFYFDHTRPVEEDVVHRMQSVARHRGPDDSGIYVRANVGLGFNRLSIIDLPGGHQPMSNEDGSVWIVFNGEIYNFLDLHEDLVSRGHRFQTRSDTECIVHAWEEYGEACVDKLRGMFAFALWDERRQALFGARDRLGIKPFYYHQNTERFAFASEVKSLLELTDIAREPDPAVIYEYLRRRYVIGPNTMLRGIRKLPPAHALRVDRSGVRSWQYWDVPFAEPVSMPEDEALERLDALLGECLRMHLVADVPLGAFLSGGIDSSAVVGLMSRLGVKDIKTFSIGYDSAESELDYARVVATHFHTDHHELRLAPGTFRDVLPKIAWYMDEPVGDTASIPLYFLAQFARREVTVALSGEGSDEIFGGYPIYRRMLGYERVNRLPLAGVAGRLIGAFAGDTKIRKYADMLGRPLEWRYGGVGGLFSQQQANELVLWSGESQDGVAAAYARCQGRTPLGRMSYVDLKTWLADDLLVKADRMSMANSLELRVPFLDHRLVEFAAALPDRLKVHGSVTKYLLKKWAERLLPREIVYRAKKGFPVPVKSWFREELSGFARETLSASGGICAEFLSRPALNRVFEAHRYEDRSTQIYSLLVVHFWFEEVVKARPLQTAALHNV